MHQSDDNGYYKHSTLEINLADQTLTLTFASEHKAERLVQFLDELKEERGDAAERGYEALERVDYDEGEQPDDDDRRRVASIPHPQRARAALGWLPLVLLPVIGLVIFFVSLMLARGWRDDAVFDIVKTKQA